MVVLVVVVLLAITLPRFTVWGGGCSRSAGASRRPATAASRPPRSTSRTRSVGDCPVSASVRPLRRIRPARHFESFYELYKTAAAVLGGCSLRGGEGALLAVGAALCRCRNITLIGGSTQRRVRGHRRRDPRRVMADEVCDVWSSLADSAQDLTSANGASGTLYASNAEMPRPVLSSPSQSGGSEHVELNAAAANRMACAAAVTGQEL